MEDTTRFLRPYFWILALLFILRLILSFVRVSEGAAAALNPLVTCVFLALPIFGLFRAAEALWTPKLGVTFLGVGVLAHGLCLVALRSLTLPPLLGAIVEAVGQTGLVLWCTGLGALVSILIRDKNLLIPVALFLAGFDAFLILTPTSIPQKIMRASPEAFRAVAVKIPGVGIAPVAFVGPADIFFLAMFFVALHKFKMRTVETMRWMIPVLVAYLFIVILFGSVSVGPIQLGTLPALVPIGLTVLIVNWKEFQLTKDEKAASFVVGLMALALAGYGYAQALKASTEPASPAAPSRSGASAGSPAPADSLVPAPTGRLR